jgi:AcrR family transcriptional regulator
MLQKVKQHSPSESSRQTLRSRFREETAREILAAAESVFAEQGLHGASMAQIAERAGVAVGTLYNRFADREALLDALLAHRRAELLEKLDGELASRDSAPLREQLTAFWMTLFSHFEAHRPFLRIVFENEQNLRREEMQRAMYERVEALVRRGVREKILRRDADHSFAVMLIGAAKGLLSRETRGLEPLTPKAAVESLMEFFFNGAAR